MTDRELDRIEKAARSSLWFGGNQMAQICLDLIAEIRRLQKRYDPAVMRTTLECPLCKGGQRT